MKPKKSWREKLATSKDLPNTMVKGKRTFVADHEKKLFTKLC